MSTSIQAYKNQSNPKAQKDLIEQHAPMVKRIAYHLLGRLPKSVMLEDLIQAGMIGLLEAASNYDASKGASFETYAGIRIRGTMLDEVRKNDWVPRSVYRNSRKITKAVQEIENEYGRDARDHEVAARLNVSLDDYHSMLRDNSTAQVFGYEDVGIDDDVMSEGYTSHVMNPWDDVQRDKFHKELTAAIKTLPEREQLVLSLYYDEEMNLKEIGEVLEVSESRVCQIHSQAMHRIRARVGQWNQ